MSNESKTDEIVREHFKQFKDEISIEEKQSDNPQIRNLLRHASKQGTNEPGYPDFIISFRTEPDLIIAIECKADKNKLQSNNKDKVVEYAVDGSLWYASFLRKNFDVISIGVSGETLSELSVSHTLCLRDGRKSPIFDDILLSANDYLIGYRHDPATVRQDYGFLLKYAKELNKDLHKQKIKEDKRSVLVSSILIALGNEAFKKSFGSHKNPSALANQLVSTVVEEFKSAEVEGKKLKAIKANLGFITADQSLSVNEGVLKRIIDSVDDNINSFLKTHEYIDVLSQFYVEFLRYSNSDKSLGIVLTPLHITEFFSELAQVNKKSIVYDNCAGTGGFLISAMKRMVEDAKSDSETIESIKKNQLFGVEVQGEIYTLAVSNMYIHQDGKSNILYDDCFNVTERIKHKIPNIGFLNPPYKLDKASDTDELEFVLNNLECLVDGGTCIAIVPMQSALAVSGTTFQMKKKLLKKHTLEAVLSMPNELFFNSNTSVVTCIMIFTAHKPHSKDKETFFGYYKDDGFVKRKIEGRFDAHGTWNEIKENWLKNFRNRTSVPELSVTKVVTAKMEWCAEAYLETDYSQLQNSDFEDAVLDYVTYLYRNRII